MGSLRNDSLERGLLGESKFNSSAFFQFKTERLFSLVLSSKNNFHSNEMWISDKIVC
jgi:hypothetical protein